ncbi:MAG: hypothetical protein H6813_02545 [Phycisphaeraceae bacterium]|nr:hypothetical protein [Phycisphaeraceae bacterium]MCB9848805.1 hypothetical protein [Phycisphaeraceae bacterium]
MDTAVAFVEAYLYINGYFTVTEYPVVEAMKHGGFRTATDLDVLAIRFPGAGRLVPSSGKRKHDARFEPDPELCGELDTVDMIIGEVKEGRAELNHGARNPDVLRVVLTRFGCCPVDHVGRIVEDLLHKGRTLMPNGHRVRLIAFGSTTGEPLGYPCEVISLKHVLRFSRAYLREHWDVLKLAQFKDTAMSILAIQEKCGDHVATNAPSRD